VAWRARRQSDQFWWCPVSRVLRGGVVEQAAGLAGGQGDHLPAAAGYEVLAGYMCSVG
jgi:hypothetical protein